jgi:predicted nucleic acid-binding protein
MRVLLDTNVVLDFILKRTPFNVEAKETFLRAAHRQIEIFVSPITPINAFYTTRKEKGKDTAFESIEKLLKIVRLTKSNKLIFQNALALNFNDYEDAV